MLSNRRKRHVIHRGLQYRFAAICIAYVLVFVVILSLALFLPVILDLHASTDNPERALRAADRLLYLHDTFWLVVAVSLVAIGLHAIRLSHRLAGPLYRYKRIFQSLKEGKMPEAIRGRRGDYLLEETAALNQMLEGLRYRLAAFREDQAQINESIREIAGLAEKGGKKEVSKRIAEVTAQGQDIINRLDGFLNES